MTTTVTTIVLLVISFFLKKHDHMDSGNEVQELLKTYGHPIDGLNPAKERNGRMLGGTAQKLRRRNQS
jgi:hypothetical protein